MKRNAMAVILALAMTAGMLAGCGVQKVTESSKDTKAVEREAGKEETEVPDTQVGDAAMEVPEEITIYTYYADAGIELIDRTVERMGELYPGLKINIEHRTDGDGSVLKTRAAVGELPDIFDCMGTLTDTLTKSGDLAELDDVMEESGLTDKFYDDAFRASEDGHYYAIEAYPVETCMIYYNTEVFEKLGLTEPKNYDEFKEVVKTLAENDVIPLALFGQEKWPGIQMYDLAVIGQGQEGGLMAIDDGTAKITDPEYIEAAKKVEELVSLGMIGKGALNTNASQAFELIGSGQAGMLINGSWFFVSAQEAGWAGHINYFKFNPFTDAGKESETQWHMSGGTGSVGGMAVSAKGQNAEFCKKFLMDWVYEKTIISAKQGNLSPIKETVELDEARAPYYQDFADHIGDIVSKTKFEWNLSNQELRVALGNNTELLNTGSFKAEDFIVDLDEQIQEILGE